MSNRVSPVRLELPPAVSRIECRRAMPLWRGPISRRNMTEQSGRSCVMSRIALVAAAVFTLSACGQSSASSPTAPTTSSPTPGPPAGPAYDWLVTHRFESVTGPDNCWVQAQRQSLTGVVFPNLEMSVTRSGNSIRIESPWFQDYVGTFSGNEFSATGENPLQGGGRPCADGSLFIQLPASPIFLDGFPPTIRS